jgi:hypothetical protein
LQWNDGKLIIATGSFTRPLNEEAEELCCMIRSQFFRIVEFGIPWISMISEKGWLIFLCKFS